MRKLGIIKNKFGVTVLTAAWGIPTGFCVFEAVQWLAQLPPSSCGIPPAAQLSQSIQLKECKFINSAQAPSLGYCKF